MYFNSSGRAKCKIGYSLGLKSVITPILLNVKV